MSGKRKCFVFSSVMMVVVMWAAAAAASATLCIVEKIDGDCCGTRGP
jgi:hypothetical protein